MPAKSERNLPAWVRLVKSVLFGEYALYDEEKLDEFSDVKGDGRYELVEA